MYGGGGGVGSISSGPLSGISGSSSAKSDELVSVTRVGSSINSTSWERSQNDFSRFVSESLWSSELQLSHRVHINILCQDYDTM